MICCALAAVEYIWRDSAVLLSDHPSTVNKYSLAHRVPPLLAFYNFMYLWGLVSLTSSELNGDLSALVVMYRAGVQDAPPEMERN